VALDKLICSKCMDVHFVDSESPESCPACHSDEHHVYNFRNSDEFLEKEIPRVLEERSELGLQGLVGGLSFVIINTEEENLRSAVEEYLKYTGFEYTDGFEDDTYRTCVLEAADSPAVLIRARLSGSNPFSDFNNSPKAGHLPNTRLETFVFSTPDLAQYSGIQRSRGVHFQEDSSVETDAMAFLQTIPSKFHGSSIGFVQWKSDSRSFRTPGCSSLDWKLEKPLSEHLRNIFELDHTATRVHAEDRDRAIIEFMELTGYNFTMAIYVKDFNSITSVARLSEKDFAMVFTSGILPDNGQEDVGPTEQFIRNYGTRVHHLAFRTEEIDSTFRALGNDGMGFLLGLVGSPEEGLKQTFSDGSTSTLLVNEYIQRFGDFNGFFTANNVTLLTESTAWQ
jgi:4-hydroxyphenylpyruvate dioxygenase-like putative hemolysin